MNSMGKMKRRTNCWCLSIVALCGSLAGAGFAQTATTSLRGDISDSTGALIPNVDVTISESAIGFVQTHQTDDKGGYNFQQIPPGTYLIKIRAQGFNEQTEKVVLLVNQPATVNIVLKVGGNST